MAVGVGNYDKNELKDIAGQDSSLVFEVTDFDALESFTKKITETICSIGMYEYLRSNKDVIFSFNLLFTAMLVL